ncbi:unnamed protein product [Rhizoctonia solani]|uniref:RBR-type E3 ubiquitin transferase n=1 Tax=Rhizoctonia solani TaxID=456999 RepID=A0A8H3BAG9_9AGAM|nr:unnamed protein product [Rhizoctonia solani]
MSSLSSILEESEDVLQAGEVIVTPDRAPLSRSRVTYRGPNTYRSKRIDIPRMVSFPVPELESDPESGYDPEPSPACEICLEVLDLLSPTSRCSHDPMICASCLGKYVTHAIKSGGLATLVCPAVVCEEDLEYEEVVKYMGEDTECLDQFNSLIAQIELEQDPNFMWCTNPTCGQGQIHTPEGPIVTCDYCHTKSCLLHQVPWHEGFTCEEYTVDQETFANQEYLTRHTKRCPSKTCGRPIEKISGCDRMTCRCGHQFCWACLADYVPISREGNHRHNSSCTHYAANPPIRNPRIITPAEMNPLGACANEPHETWEPLVPAGVARSLPVVG